MRRIRLDLRRVFRAIGKEEQAGWSANIDSAGGPPNKDGGKKGGSLSREVKKAKYLRVKRWGYVLRIAALGQKLTWFVRGTKRQPARPVAVPKVPADAEDRIAAEIAAQWNAWQESKDVRRA